MRASAVDRFVAALDEADFLLALISKEAVALKGCRIQVIR
jgi:hypothetical protein